MVLLAVVIAWATFWRVPRSAVIAGNDRVTQIDMSSITTQRPVEELNALLEARRKPAA